MSITIKQIDFMVDGLRTVSEANQREHWRTRYKRKQSQQDFISAWWQNVVRGRQIELPCRVKLTRIGPKALDTDNLAGSFKHVQDAIAKKLGVDDGASQVTWEYHQMPIGVRSYGVKIEITSHANTSLE